MGSVETPTAEILSSYSIPDESAKLLRQGLLENPKISKDIPLEAHSFASRVKFSGGPLPSIPINWRFAESAASLKGFEACIVSALLKRKYSVDLAGAAINTDHAQLFFMSTLIWKINPGSDNPITLNNKKALDELIPDYDFHKMGSSLFREFIGSIAITLSMYFTFHHHADRSRQGTP
jgi:hypothetical protein